VVTSALGERSDGRSHLGLDADALNMPRKRQDAEFPEQADENRRIWDANALWWDDRIGDGNDFQRVLIEPATERLLNVVAGDTILDAACGAGRFARRMAELGARVVAFDGSAEFIARARERTSSDAAVEYHVVDAADAALLSLGSNRFNKVVCTMAIMDMPEIGPLFATLSRMLVPGAAFVFSVTHPCFHSAAIQRFAEIHEEQPGRHMIRSGVKVSSYLSPFARKTEAIIGQPEPQWFFHRPISTLFRFGFEAGFVVDGTEEPHFPEDEPKAGVRWRDMPDIPPVMVVRMKLMRGLTGDRISGN
jgi:2-polyprenyl-3-methyl-5-hydroxy-6-metoxy-1,4-benzoquinol methylase